MVRKFLLFSLIFNITFLSVNFISYAQEETADSPAPRVPRPKSYAPEKSSFPVGRPDPIRVPSEQFINELRAKPCPGDEYCPGLPTTGNRERFSKKCLNFIAEDGYFTVPRNESDGYEKHGFGLLMVEAMQEVERAHPPVTLPDGTTEQCKFSADFNFGYSCPNFKYMSPVQKQHVWVWYWASLAQSESSCNSSADAVGIENEALGRMNIADGLFGLEYNADTREASGRDPRFCPHTGTDSQNPYFQSRCAASIMYDTQCGKSVFFPSSYWEQNSYQFQKVSILLQRHPLCKLTPK